MAAGLVDGVPAKKVCGFVEEIEGLMAEREKLRERCAQKCAGVGEQISGVYGAAKDAGLDAKALKRVVRTRELERKAAAERAKLEAPLQDTFDRIRLALGDLADLPLGQSVLREVSGGVKIAEMDYAAAPAA